MIPKIIHYCWFGGGEKSEIIEKCIASWKKYCPGYEIIEWNESNYDYKAHPFALKAYKDKKWAFVSDVARLEVIYRFGGIYLDTDVEILKPDIFDSLLNNEVVMSFENARSISSGLIYAAEKGLSFTKKMLDCYNDKKMLNSHYITNVTLNRPIIKECYPQINWNGQTQKINDLYLMGTEEYGAVMKHYGTRTWLPDGLNYKKKQDSFIKKRLKNILRNPKIFSKLEKNRIGKKILPLYTLLAYDILDMGLMYFIKLKI